MKKYKNIVKDMEKVISLLEKGEFIGVAISNTGTYDVFKARFPNSDIPCGASGGYRMIYYVVNDACVVYLLTVYCKRDKENISNKEIEKLILEEFI